MSTIVVPPIPSDATRAAQHIFAQIAPELSLVEQEFERQARSNVQVIAMLGNRLQLSGGKRLRPALTIFANRAVGGDASRHNVIRMATVMEFLHTATLVHDDIIDNATMRRNQPSINGKFGNNIAVLMGDWLYMSAFETSLAERSLPILTILTKVTRKMVEGELMQLETKGRSDVTEDLYFEILQRKTAYLCSACCEIGAILGDADASRQQALEQYGMNLGITFQLIDDLLDFTSSDEVLGKATGADLLEGVLTLPLIYLLEREPSMRGALETVMRDRSFKEIPRETLLHMLNKSQSLERAFERARRFASAAGKELEALPRSHYRDTLESLLLFVLARKH